MDSRKILETITLYREFFESHKIGKKKVRHQLSLADFVTPSELTLPHCHGMLDQMEQFVAEGRIDKVFRWPGFIQGCLWSAGCYTLEELKNHSRPDTAV